MTASKSYLKLNTIALKGAARRAALAGVKLVQREWEFRSGGLYATGSLKKASAHPIPASWRAFKVSKEAFVITDGGGGCMPPMTFADARDFLKAVKALPISEEVRCD